MNSAAASQVHENAWDRRVLVAVLVVGLAAGLAAAAAVEPFAAALAVTAGVAAVVALRRPEALLGAWIALSPWASYWLRYPAERSIATFDRVVVIALIGGFVARTLRERGRPAPLAFIDTAWLAFSVVALASGAMLSEEKGLGLRTAVDAFLLPGLLLYAVRNGFDVVAGRRAVFCGAVALALTLPWAGLYEFFTAHDVLPFKGSSLFRTGIVRANGPFATDNSYAIVSALVGVFLVWLPTEMRLALDGSARFIRRAAIGAAFLAALVPVFRTIIGAVAVALAIPSLVGGRIRTLARAALIVLLLGVASLPLLVPLARTATFQDRIADPSSAFSRVATYLAAADIIGDHPLAGVGLFNYKSAFDARFGTAWYTDVEAVNNIGAEAYPHNNVLGLWAETGLFGVFFYVCSSIALAGLAWQRRNLPALALMAVYWIAGMTLYSCLYADLNMVYYALVGVLLAKRPNDAQS